MVAQKIVPNIWFDDQAEQAAGLYTSLFPRSRIHTVTRYTKAGQEIHGQPEGKVMAVDFEVDGYRLACLNGGPHFELNPSISLFAVIETEAEADRIWDALVEGGSVMMPLGKYDWSPKYGWLNDRFGLSWQLTVGNRADMGGHAISPSLLFVGAQHGRAEEAMRFYSTVFKPGEVQEVYRYDGKGTDPAGTVAFGQFSLHHQTFVAMDSAQQHDFAFNEALSLIVRCETQDEIDDYWSKLSAVPEAERCGWLKDKFGVSWEVVPTVLFDMLQDPDRAKVERVTAAYLRMKKFDIEALKAAYAG